MVAIPRTTAGIQNATAAAVAAMAVFNRNVAGLAGASPSSSDTIGTTGTILTSLWPYGQRRDDAIQVPRICKFNEGAIPCPPDQECVPVWGAVTNLMHCVPKNTAPEKPGCCDPEEGKARHRRGDIGGHGFGSDLPGGVIVVRTKPGEAGDNEMVLFMSSRETEMKNGKVE